MPSPDGPTRIPAISAPDSTLAFLRDGYDFIATRCDALGTDAFRTRILLRKVTCVRGPEAVAAFYAPGRMSRRGAMPVSVMTLLQDRGSVQTLDGEAHRRRKALFLDLMTPERLEAARAILAEELARAAAEEWRGRKEVVLSDAIGGIMCRTALRWCDLPLEGEDIAALARELSAMIAGAGRIGPDRLRAGLLRARSERRMRDRIAAARQGHGGQGWVIDRLIAHRDADGSALDDAVAAVELLNILRPVVAIGRFIVFAVHARACHTGAAHWLEARGDEAACRAFGEEVRRVYPFFPVIGGRVREAFDWRGERFGEGDWILLDLYGTCRDGSVWPAPAQFDPERHMRPPPPGAMVPQGGGDMEEGHRCPGEDLTRALLTEAIGFFLGLDYEVPAQDLQIPHDRFPPWPRDGMRLGFSR
ncbi:cytochrome P450 [Celeribacter indicus]|uniref:Fatty acid alpha hydroxylase n=1 Tax=Celeribacter indicus TaxID=1208324 RepID=A0A0B5E196_9RHOB|nr:cytochrome P450 [Celeribacter indicus]AJE49059.1 fatty acid alpha hydroxylase [Celeribacter indicus]SDW44886.1 fatty-acid peroxygenase [Celeribacter indicus]